MHLNLDRFSEVSGTSENAVVEVALAAMEELGEFSKEMLVAAGIKQSGGSDGLKGEAIDVLICALDLANKVVGLDTDEFETIFNSKLDKWSAAVFRGQWAGRKYQCNDTGAVFTIPESVKECDFFVVGDGFVDVGRLGAYCRTGGNISRVGED